jgi:hypothetical protein
MKKLISLILLIVGITLQGFTFGNNKAVIIPNPNGFALIEVFSSEGCSSCPPAEAVMHKMIQDAKAESMPVYIIEFHVDYWNYLGWKDTFATHEYTQRQQEYGDFFKLNSVYTPQAIINGKSEMVGSDEDKINAAVAEELKSSNSIGIDCKAHKTDNSKIEVDYNITGAIAGCNLNFAVVESNLTTHIIKGENSGKTLTHDNVARVFKSIELNAASGKLSIEVPHVNLRNAKVICFLQNTETRNISGATQVAINQ